MGITIRAWVAGAALAASAGSVLAADIIPSPVYEAPPPPPVGGWYLRGDIGISNQQLHGDLYNLLMENTDNFQFIDSGTFSAGNTYRVGIGYKYSDWLRFDATAELRGKTDFSALDRYSDPAVDANPDTWDGTNDYRARKREWLYLANAYFDLGTWNGITPYAGVGAGMAQVTITDFTDVNVPTSGVAYAQDHTQWNFAWALHAGLGFDVTDRLTLDLGYSYVNLGEGRTGDTIAFDGTNSVNNPFVFEEITSHDLKFGLRYKFF